SGEIAADTAYHLTRVEDVAVQDQLASETADGVLSRDALARKLKRTRLAGEREAAGLVRVTAMLAPGRAVTVAGQGLTLDTLIEWLEALRSRARKAKGRGLTLHTFVRTLKDQASA